MVEMPEGKKVPYWNTFYQRIDEKADGIKRIFWANGFEYPVG